MDTEKYARLTDVIDQRDRATRDAGAAWDLINECVNQIYGVDLGEILNAYERLNE